MGFGSWSAARGQLGFGSWSSLIRLGWVEKGFGSRRGSGSASSSALGFAGAPSSSRPSAGVVTFEFSLTANGKKMLVGFEFSHGEIGILELEREVKSKKVKMLG